ncbi:MAG: ABC transporter ATP-binding protein [Desulfobacter sp.]|nr:MAG: ABC transporter ATP-binding protein [Desulfobacter sp.]
MAVLVLKAVSFTHDGRQRPALDHVDLTLDRGEFAVVSGASGSGKTSLCYLAAGLIPDIIRGRLGGSAQGVTGCPAGLMLQNPHAQLSGMAFTAEEEVAMALENQGIAPARMEALIRRAMDLAGVSGLADRDPADLSGGQVQRLVLAAVLAPRPDLLVLDEPASQMDPMGREGVYRLARHLADQGRTVLMADKDLERAARFAHRLVVMDKGAIVLDGPAPAIAAHSDIPELGLIPPRYTTAARMARDRDLWPVDRGLPATLAQAEKGFSTP